MDTIKIMTLNCHSLEEKNYKEKLEAFVLETVRLKPQIIALQEVNQSINAKAVSDDMGYGYYPCDEEAVIKEDNHAFNAAKRLQSLGYPMHWTWTPAKKGYDKYEEGLALFSAFPISEAQQVYTTISRDFDNWKVRKALSIVSCIGNKMMQFVSVHMGWWEDKEEPFISQWENLEKIAERNDRCFVMGDFNSPASMKNGGYDYIISKGWKDTYQLAKARDEGFTVCKKIDGWRNRDSEENMRIDFIFTDGADDITVESSAVVFNGKNGPVVSDHFGVMISCSQDSGGKFSCENQETGKDSCQKAGSACGLSKEKDNNCKG